jgi:hypothetical protein
MELIHPKAWSFKPISCNCKRVAVNETGFQRENTKNEYFFAEKRDQQFE